jgi:hypothetical protein
MQGRLWQDGIVMTQLYPFPSPSRGKPLSTRRVMPIIAEPRSAMCRGCLSKVLIEIGETRNRTAASSSLRNSQSEEGSCGRPGSLCIYQRVCQRRHAAGRPWGPERKPTGEEMRHFSAYGNGSKRSRILRAGGGGGHTCRRRGGSIGGDHRGFDQSGLAKNVSRALPQTTLPRISDRDVKAGPAEGIEVAVWGVGRDIAFRQGHPR